MEGLFYEGLRIFLDAVTMTDDQLVEVPRKQLFKRALCEISMSERQPDVERNAALRIGNASSLKRALRRGLPFTIG